MIPVNPKVKGLKVVTFIPGESEEFLGASPLPIIANQDSYGTAITCWKFSLWERLTILIFGKLYITVLGTGKSFPPMCMELKKPQVWQTHKQF